MIPVRALLPFLKAFRKLRSYEPQPVTLRGLAAWVRQFPKESRADLLRIVAGIRYVTEDEAVRTLLDLNERVIASLEADGVAITNVIYMSTDSAGSSSGVMLNLLRDRANLEKRGARFLHTVDGIGISTLTTELEAGAIIYVDDFAATGKQFIRSRRSVAEYVVGSFSEFFLLPCACEEAVARIDEQGVVTEAGFIHGKRERPLLPESDILSHEQRNRILALSAGHWPARIALGFDGMATNVVYYRNAPNTTPLIFRGHLGQNPIVGILPRWSDLQVL